MDTTYDVVLHQGESNDGWDAKLNERQREALSHWLDNDVHARERELADGDRTFGMWLIHISYVCAWQFGTCLNAFDLPDVPWRQWYDDDLRPGAALNAALRQHELDKNRYHRDSLLSNLRQHHRSAQHQCRAADDCATAVRHLDHMALIRRKMAWLKTFPTNLIPPSGYEKLCRPW